MFKPITSNEKIKIGTVNIVHPPPHSEYSYLQNNFNRFRVFESHTSFIQNSLYL